MLAALVAGVLIAWLLRVRFSDREIRAYVSPTEVELGQPILFSDSTHRAQKVLWEFGNGDMSVEKSGSYIFPHVGRYQVRVKVDDELEARFLVNVREPVKQAEVPIRIIAPSSAIQNELISCMAEGPSQEWRWEFGESGEVDSREKNPTYSYQYPGTYEVRLTSEDTEYPIIHHIEILPEYTESESTDVLSLIAMDIRERLQDIVDGGSFNTNYNYILENYLCNKPDVLVVVNGTKQNDFYSYCHGLKFIGSQFSTSIIEVVAEADKNSVCIKKLLVRQSSPN